MDLISTVYGSRRPETYLGQIPISSKWYVSVPMKVNFR